MPSSRIDRIHTLLKGIETGDAAAASVVNEAKYIQHNPQTREGSEGLAALFKRLAKTNPRVNIVRAFEDGDFVFAHTEYDFASSNVGFEIFRFEGNQAVEHWDNIQPRLGPNASAHTMVDGPTEVVDLELTAANRDIVERFVREILIDRRMDNLDHYVVSHGYIEHNPHLADGIDQLHSTLAETRSGRSHRIEYRRLHRVLAQGCFVLSVCEGSYDGVHSSFFDLFRVVQNKVVEHWDTTEAIPPRSAWKNDNGKF